jgi:hypothetical protein
MVWHCWASKHLKRCKLEFIIAASYRGGSFKKEYEIIKETNEQNEIRRYDLQTAK